jgi:hypothetical protein
MEHPWIYEAQEEWANSEEGIQQQQLLEEWANFEEGIQRQRYLLEWEEWEAAKKQFVKDLQAASGYEDFNAQEFQERGHLLGITDEEISAIKQELNAELEVQWCENQDVLIGYEDSDVR